MVLNQNYRIVWDTENCILQFFEQREKKSKETGEKTPFEYIENYYYPNLKTALLGFLNKSTWELKTAEEILERIEQVETIIKQIK